MRKLKFTTQQVRRASTVLSKLDIRYSDIVDIMIYVVQKPSEYRTHSDLMMLKQATRNFSLFTSLSDVLHEHCCKSFQYQFVPKEKFIFKEGDKADKFYLIISGRVQVLKDFNPNDPQGSIYDNEITQMTNGEFFGERGMDTESTRTATCRALEDTHLAYLNKQNYDILIRTTNSKAQMKRSYFEEFANLDMFKSWRFHDIKAFYDRATVQQVCMHSVVYREGDPIDSIYIIKKGEFKIVKTIKTSTIDLNDMFKGDFEKILAGMSSPKTQTISEIIEARYQRERYGNMYYQERKKQITIKYLTTGQMFGEMEFLMQQNQSFRTHSVISVTDQSELYQIKRESFELILEKIPSIRAQLTILSEQKNQNFIKQILSYEKNFNDLTDVRKDLEKNINLDFLWLGSKEKPKPQLVMQKLKTPKIPKIPSITAMTERQVTKKIETKRKILIRRKSTMFNSFKTLKLDCFKDEDPCRFNFVGSVFDSA